MTRALNFVGLGNLPSFTIRHNVGAENGRGATSLSELLGLRTSCASRSQALSGSRSNTARAGAVVGAGAVAVGLMVNVLAVVVGVCALLAASLLSGCAADRPLRTPDVTETVRTELAAVAKLDGGPYEVAPAFIRGLERAVEVMAAVGGLVSDQPALGAASAERARLVALVVGLKAQFPNVLHSTWGILDIAIEAMGGGEEGSEGK